MITKNTNGQNLSAGFIAALTAENRVYDAKILLNGTALDCSVNSITITKGSCGSDTAFTVGNVVGSALTASVTGLATAIKGKEIEVHIGLEVSGAFEYISLGKFVVSEAPQNVYATNITAYSTVITRTGAAFTPPQTKTLANIAASIASTVSALAGRTVTVTFGSGITTSKTITADLSNLTVYQALQILAGAVGGYAVDTYDGNIKICRFDDTPTLVRTTDTMVNLPVVEETDFEISGVVCIVTQATDTAPAVQYPANPTGLENLIVENQYMTEDLYTSYLSTLTGYTYRPADIGLTYGDPRLEGDDVVQVTDINEDIYIIPCHMLTHTYAGGFSTRVVSVTATEQENDVASSAGSLTQQVSQIGANAISAKASAAAAKEAADEAQRIVGDLEDQVDDLEDRVEAAEGDITTIEGNITGLQTRVGTAEGNITTIEGNITTLQGRVADAEEDVDDTLKRLAVAQDIAGTLEWLTQHGTMALTQDASVDPTHIYFVVDQSGDYLVGSTRYSLVKDPKTAELSTYYELTITNSIENYVATHLSVTSEGLWLIPDSGGNKVLIAVGGSGHTYEDAGTYILDGSNNVLAQFLASGAQIGQTTGGRVLIDNDSIDITDPNGVLATFDGTGIQFGESGPNKCAVFLTEEGFLLGYKDNPLFKIGVQYSVNRYPIAGIINFKNTNLYTDGPYGHVPSVKPFNYLCFCIDGSPDIALNNTVKISKSTNTYPLVIGNNPESATRENILTVDWAGDVCLALDTAAASGTTDGDLYAAISALGWQSDVIV